MAAYDRYIDTQELSFPISHIEAHVRRPGHSKERSHFPSCVAALNQMGPPFNRSNKPTIAVTSEKHIITLWHQGSTRAGHEYSFN
jgi:hypothetical protein